MKNMSLKYYIFKNPKKAGLIVLTKKSEKPPTLITINEGSYLS